MSQLKKGTTDDYKDPDDDEDLNQSDGSISDLTVEDDDQSDFDDYDVHQEGKKKANKNKKLNKKQEQKKKKRKKNQLVEEEAEEASDEESELDDEFREVLNREDQKEVEQILKKRDIRKKNIVEEMENRYKNQQEDDGSDGLVSVEEDEIFPPKIEDPKIWRVICNRGKEKESVFQLMFKYSSFSKSNFPLEIVSAFHLPKFPGVIFIEAYFEQQVLKAIEGFYEIKSLGIVPLDPDQCVNLFQQVEQEKITLQQGQWVRIKAHQFYQGDLGRILSIDEGKRTAEVKLIPREKREMISYQMQKEKDKENQKSKKSKSVVVQDDEVEEVKQPDDERKHNKWFYRNKQLLEQKRFLRGPKIPIKFENQKNYGEDEININDKNSHFFYNNLREERENCRKDGFLILRTSITNLIAKNIKISNGELSQFYPDVKDINIVLRKFHSSLIQASESSYQFQVGDPVTLRDQLDMKFKVTKVLSDNKLIVKAKSKDIQVEQQVDADQVKLIFSKYQQVAVISGQFKGESGVIIEVNNNSVSISTEQNRVIHVQMSDIQNQRNIRGNDSQNNAEINPIPVQQPQNEANQFKDNKTGGISRNDLIRFGTVETEIGCVLAISNDQYKVLDITNNVRYIKQMNIIGKLNTRNNIAKNQYEHSIKQSDLVAILEGFYKSKLVNLIKTMKGCKATVLHVFRDFLFLFSGKFDHTQGVIIEKVTNCTRISSTANTEMRNRPIQQAQDSTEFSSGKAPDYQNLVGQNITIGGGQWAGYRGMVVSVQSKSVKVQLTAKNLTVNVLKEHLGGQQEQSGSANIQSGKTPHYAPQQSVRVWDYDQDRREGYQGYQSPYVYNNQTPGPEY